MKNRINLIFYLLLAAIFLGIAAPDLFTDGMFMDGLLYAAISNNLAEGLGSLWKPHLSTGLFPEFYEHPPLAFGLQSLWFMAFGDSIFVERFYALTTFLITGGLMVMIWKEVTGSYKTGWIPMIFWISVPVVIWSCVNNMLENSMTIFTCLAAWFLIKYGKTKPLVGMAAGGTALALALLTKGFVALYLWTIPLFSWIVLRREPFGKVILQTSILVFFTLLPVALLFFFSSDASHNMISYFNKQVLGSIQNVATVETRFYIVGKFFQHILVPLLFALVILGIEVFGRRSLEFISKNGRTSLLFLLVVFSGILPIMISMKQRGFYITSVYPFFALGLGYLLSPVLLMWKDQISERSSRIIAAVTALAVITALGITIWHFDNDKLIRRNRLQIADCHQIVEKIGEHQVVGICPDLYTDWSLHGYLVRYGHISLDKNPNNGSNYLLIEDTCESRNLENFIEVETSLNRYRLFKKE